MIDTSDWEKVPARSGRHPKPEGFDLEVTTERGGKPVRKGGEQAEDMKVSDLPDQVRPLP